MIAVCEAVFRGVKMEELYTIRGESSLPDFQLVPKHLEQNYTFTATSKQMINKNILPRYMEFPPLMKDILIKNGTKDPKLPVVKSPSERSFYRVAEEGEQPTKIFKTGFGTPKSPNLLKGVNYDI